MTVPGGKPTLVAPTSWAPSGLLPWEGGAAPPQPGQPSSAVLARSIPCSRAHPSPPAPQPFKDNADLPDPEQGWSPERSRRLGAALLQAILQVAPSLR